MVAKKTKRSPIIYAAVAWMAINIILMIIVILGGDFEDLSNWIEIGLWATSIPALLSNRKWGIPFAIFTLTYTLSTSVGILIYFQIWINAIRVIINIPLIIYFFKLILQTKNQLNYKLL